MTLEFLKECGADDDMAQAVLARHKERMDEAMGREALAKAREAELEDRIKELEREARSGKIDLLLDRSGIRSALVRSCAHNAMLSGEIGKEEEYLDALKIAEPDLFAPANEPRFVNAESDSDLGISSRLHFLRRPKGGGV